MTGRHGLTVTDTNSAVMGTKVLPEQVNRPSRPGTENAESGFSLASLNGSLWKPMLKGTKLEFRFTLNLACPHQKACDTITIALRIIRPPSAHLDSS